MFFIPAQTGSAFGQNIMKYIDINNLDTLFSKSHNLWINRQEQPEEIRTEALLTSSPKVLLHYFLLN